MKSAKSKRQITLLTLVLALGVAVYLNWQYAKSSTDFITAEGVAAVNGSSISGVATADATVDAEAATSAITTGGIQEALPDKNYGDAQLVNTSKSGEYFEQARLTRGKTRDEALDKLQKSLKSANLSDAEKEALTGNLSTEIASITAESDIENLVKAKGFADCVAFIDGEKVNVAVKTGGGSLDSTSVVRIRDVVLSKVETDAQNIAIVEVK